MPASEENVLVIRRSLLDSLGAFQGLCDQPQRYLSEFLKRENNFFMPRSKAEPDPTHKQLIPYAVFTCGDRILHYVRGGASGEKRLVAKGSIGIGGHINDSDESLFSFDADSYRTAVHREINEELRIKGTWSDRVVALINDDSTEVGSVHLGVVHLVTLESEAVTAGEKAIARLEFLSREELAKRSDTLETWSRIILDGWNHLVR